jgi:L-fuculose-phosphate aldolase
MMVNEWKIKQQICDIGKRMYDRGFVAANDGNISFRLGNGRFLCTPTGVSKGFLKPADIAVVDDKGKQLSGAKPRTSEILLHLEIYHERPEINAVCHAHSPHATAFAVAGVDLPSGILPEVELFIGQVPIAAYDTPGSKSLAETILPHLKNNANTIILANHGVVTCDKDLQQAYFHIETLETYCKILLLTKQIGNIRPLPEEKVRELLDIKEGMGISDPRLECLRANETNPEACVLAGSDEFLRGFSTVAIPQHTPDADGHGHGNGIAGAPSQAGQPQPTATSEKSFPTTVAGRKISGPDGLGSSSETVRKRAMEDEIERLVQVITDKIVQASG